MPDITMCKYNELCKKRDTCYRNTATPCEYRQSYSVFIVDCNEDNEYKYYWEDEK